METHLRAFRHYFPNATGKPYVNQTTLTNVMNYKNATGGLSQLWWEDPTTLKHKYDKVKSKGLRALGMWTADSAGMDKSKTQAMWDALPAPKTLGLQAETATLIASTNTSHLKLDFFSNCNVQVTNLRNISLKSVPQPLLTLCKYRASAKPRF